MTVHELLEILQGVDNNAMVRIISRDGNPIEDYYPVRDAYVVWPCCSDSPSGFYLVEG